jgi:hypothetical protein
MYLIKQCFLLCSVNVYGEDIRDLIRSVLSIFATMTVDDFKQLYEAFFPPPSGLKRKNFSKSNSKKKSKKSTRIEDDADSDEIEEDIEVDIVASQVQDFTTLEISTLLHSCLAQDIRSNIVRMLNDIYRWGYYGHTLGDKGTTLKDNLEGGNNLPVSIKSAVMGSLNLINLIKLYKIEGILRVSCIS